MSRDCFESLLCSLTCGKLALMCSKYHGTVWLERYHGISPIVNAVFRHLIIKLNKPTDEAEEKTFKTNNSNERRTEHHKKRDRMAVRKTVD